MSPGVQTSLKKRARSCSCLPNQTKRKQKEKGKQRRKEGKKRRQDSPTVAYARIPAKAERPQGYIMRPMSKSIRPDFISSTLNTKGKNNQIPIKRIKYLFLSNKTGFRRKNATETPEDDKRVNLGRPSHPKLSALTGASRHMEQEQPQRNQLQFQSNISVLIQEQNKELLELSTFTEHTNRSCT